MKLITKAIAATIPPLYTNENKKAEETKVPVKIFNPCGSGTWFITEYNPEDGTAFGYVCGLGEDELGYMSIPELQEVRTYFGLGLERDIHWDPNTTLAQVMAGEKR